MVLFAHSSCETAPNLSDCEDISCIHSLLHVTPHISDRIHVWALAEPFQTLILFWESHFVDLDIRDVLCCFHA